MASLNPIFGVFSDLGRNLVIALGVYGSTIPAAAVPVFSRALGGLPDYPTQVSIGTVSVNISTLATYNFGLQFAWPHHHYGIVTEITGATDFSQLEKKGAFPVSLTQGAVVIGSTAPQTIAVSYFSWGD